MATRETHRPAPWQLASSCFLIPLEAYYKHRVTCLQRIWPLRVLVSYPKWKNKDQYEREKDLHIRTALLPVAPAKPLLLGAWKKIGRSLQVRTDLCHGASHRHTTYPPLCFSSQLGSLSWSGLPFPTSALVPHTYAILFITGSTLYGATAGK